MLIGLSGWARSGKDEVGRILVERHGFERIGFADKVREVALAIDPYVRLNIPDEDELANGTYARLSDVVSLGTWDDSKVHDDVRQLLQRIGTEAGRCILGEDIWILAAFADLQPDKNYVVTDVRFPNEALAVWEHSGELWRVNRPGYGPANGHPSEIALDSWNFDSFINNAGSLRDLEEVVAIHLAFHRQEAS